MHGRPRLAQTWERKVELFVYIYVQTFKRVSQKRTCPNLLLLCLKTGQRRSRCHLLNLPAAFIHMCSITLKLKQIFIMYVDLFCCAGIVCVPPGADLIKCRYVFRREEKKHYHPRCLLYSLFVSL